MSNTEFLSPSFNDLNSNQVLQHFQVPPHDHAVRAAMNFMFRTYKDELPGSVSYTARSKAAAALTNESIEFRYCLFKEFEEDFFKGQKIERDALAIAVICNEYTPHINEPCQDKDGNLKPQYDGVDTELAELANIFWEESVSLESRGSLAYEVSPESIFLAHIIAMEAFAKYEAEMDEEDGNGYEDETLSGIVNKDIPAIRAFLRLDTEIGQQLKNVIDHFQDQYEAYMEDISEPPPPRPQLRLVPSPSRD